MDNTFDELYQHYFQKIYAETSRERQSYGLPDLSSLPKKIYATYGELLYPSVKKIIHQLRPTPHDVFLDLGSGEGKCLLQVFMQSAVHKVIGIEMMEHLHTQAQLNREAVHTAFPYFWEEGREVILFNQNFLEVPWDEATLVYSCSTCFDPKLIVAMGSKLNTCPNVRQVLSLLPLPTLTLPLKSVFRVECSWDSALCFHYSV